MVIHASHKNESRSVMTFAPFIRSLRKCLPKNLAWYLILMELHKKWVYMGVCVLLFVFRSSVHEWRKTNKQVWEQMNINLREKHVSITISPWELTAQTLKGLWSDPHCPSKLFSSVSSAPKQLQPSYQTYSRPFFRELDSTLGLKWNKSGPEKNK